MPDDDRLPEADVFLLAAVCDHRERASGPSGGKPNFDDVVSYLAFRPWVNQNRYYRYMRAVKAGTIGAALDYMELMAVGLAKSSGPKDPPFKNIRTSNYLPGLYSDYPEEFLEADYRETGPFPKPLQLLA